MMNIELAYNALEILQTMWDATKLMGKSYLGSDMDLFHKLSLDLQDGLSALRNFAEENVPAKNRIRLADACTCGLESLKDIKSLLMKAPEKIAWKLDYELAPIIETAAMQFYYWGIVVEHPEKRDEFLNFIAETEAFSPSGIQEQEVEVPIDLSIIVTAYNHFDYTLACVRSIQKNMPHNFKTELILFNHGSTDQTKEYFENYEGIKLINVAINGALPGVISKAACKGKYHLAISNDIIIGTNAIDNLLRCALEHPDYGYIVPATSAVSNLQTIAAMKYEDMEQFYQATLVNNVYDDRRHEQRVRLCNPLHLMPRAAALRMGLELYEDKLCNVLKASFPDDKNSLWMRRNGYKCILAKDAYCHHFGSVTIRQEMGKQQEQQQSYLEGRIDFFRRYGIDPWGTGFCYDLQLFDMWEIPTIDDAFILGINCGIGSNSLKVKEVLKEQGAQRTVLYNGTQDKRYLQDLKGISDDAFLFSRLRDVIKKTKRKFFHYIVVEEYIREKDSKTVLKEIQNSGLSFGELAYKASENDWKIVKGKMN